ncbi:MAG: lysostaphin resistance A-like protein [Bryobacteraceae bacterium]
MEQPFRRFVPALGVLWLCLATAGFVYARTLGLPPQMAAPLVAAFLWEASFYLAPAFASLRDAAVRRWSPPLHAAGLAVSAIAPYLVYTLPLGLFELRSAAILLLLVSAASFWFVAAPPGKTADFAFIAFMAAPILLRLFPALYPSPVANLPLAILGQLMWIRLGIWAVLTLRRVEPIGFGFWPSREEWQCGFRYFLYFLPFGVPVGLALGVIRFRVVTLDWPLAAAYAAATFFGMLWVVALSEEFYFRGLLQPWLGRLLGSRAAGLLLTSALFGLVHLPFRGFPNWRFALVAALAGVFYGLARDRSQGVRAPMVAHALVNTAMRIFFT